MCMGKQINARHCIERMTEGRDYHGQTGKDRQRQRTKAVHLSLEHFRFRSALVVVIIITTVGS